MKMLKSSLDENVWQKFYFVLVCLVYTLPPSRSRSSGECHKPAVSLSVLQVGKTIYYYKSRKKQEKTNYDDDDEDEDDEDESDMPWKGCFNVTVATVRRRSNSDRAALPASLGTWQNT